MTGLKIAGGVIRKKIANMPWMGPGFLQMIADVIKK